MKIDAKLPCCPFYLKERNRRLYCEGAIIKFPSRTSRNELVNTYCASMENYHNCAMCKMLMNYYDRKEYEDEQRKAD